MKRACWIALTFIWTSLAYGSEVYLQVDRKSLQEGETVGLYVSIVDGDATNGVRMPIVDGLSIVSRGRRQSLTTINGRRTRTVTYTYALTGLIEGQYEVPPIRLYANGEMLETNGLAISVVAANPDDVGGVFSAFNKEKMWVGQTVVHQLTLRLPSRIFQSAWRPPEMEGFSPEQSAEEEKREYNTLIDGKTWGVLELFTPLIASRAGARDIPPGLVQVETATANRRRSFFQETKTEIFPTDAIRVAVHPLPKTDPSIDYRGLVGDFQVQSSLSKSQVRVGESVTIDVVLVGDGSLLGYRLPAFPEDVGLTSYDDDPEYVSAIEDGNFIARAHFKRAVVPEVVGEITLPPIEVVTFSPTTESYVTLRKELGVLKVLAGDGVAQVNQYGTPTLVQEASKSRDILPLRHQVELGDDRLRFQPAFWIVGFSPLVVLGGLVLMKRVSQVERSVDPKRNLKKRIKGFRRIELQEQEALFRDCLAHYLRRSSAGIRRQHLEVGLQGEIREEALLIYSSFEEARYGGGQPVDSERVKRTMVALLELQK